MEPEERETTFEQVDRRYAELKRRHQDGELSDKKFEAQLKEQMVRDEEGRWWAKSPKTGNWHYYDGQAWIRGTPPVAGRNREEQRRHKRRWMLLGASFAALVVAVAAIIALVSLIGNGPSTGQPSNPSDGQNASYPADPKVVFKDDFSESSTGWDQTKEDGYGSYYEKGRYRMYMTSGASGTTRWSLADAQVPEEGAIAEVDATRTSTAPSDPSSNWGIICRASDSGNGYLMGISEAGYPIIQRLKDGTFTTLARKPSYDGHAIQGDGNTNHIQGTCIGSKLTLHVNDAKVLEAEDSVLGDSGSVGLYVQDAGFEPPGTDVFFDDFRLSAP